MVNLTSSEKTTLSLLLRKGLLSRKEIAQELSLTSAALTLICSHLLNEKLIVEVGEKKSGKAGRKELLLSLSSSYRFLGLDIKQHSFTVSSSSFSLEEVDSKRFATLSEAIVELKRLSSPSILGCGILVRGKSDQSSLEKRYPELSDFLKSALFPCFVSNNVKCLASIHHLFYPDEKNFLLIKYGPGVGSSIYVNGASISFNEGGESELGHILLDEGKTLEESICFESLLGKEVDEVEAVEKLKGNPNLKGALNLLAKSIINADRLMNFDSIVASGLLLGENKALANWKKDFTAIDPSYPIEKIHLFENYQDIDKKKCCYNAFYHLFCL